MSRFLGIDFGLARIGLALSDPLAMFARGYKTLPNKPHLQTEIIKEIQVIIAKEDVTEIVLGLPKRTDGKESTSEVLAKEFGAELQEATNLPIHYFDERFTTVIAHQILNASAKKRDSHAKRQVVDQVAAEIILQNYLDSRR